MIEVAITPEMVADAHRKSLEMGKLKGSITKGLGNLAGFIGEFLFKEVYGGEVQNTYEYDIVLDDGTKIDVKTTQTTVKPLPEYSCTVAAYNTKQQCDVYGFVRVHKDLSVGWVLGTKAKKDFFDEADHFKKGDKQNNGRFVHKADCYQVLINSLNTPPQEETKEDAA